MSCVVLQHKKKRKEDSKKEWDRGKIMADNMQTETTNLQGVKWIR